MAGKVVLRRLNMKCRKGYDIEAVQVDDYWVMGTRDRQGAPNCQLTKPCKTKKEARQQPWYGQFYVADNENCNGGKGCFE